MKADIRLHRLPLGFLLHIGPYAFVIDLNLWRLGFDCMYGCHLHVGPIQWSWWPKEMPF